MFFQIYTKRSIYNALEIDILFGVAFQSFFILILISIFNIFYFWFAYPDERGRFRRRVKQYSFDCLTKAKRVDQ